VSKAMDRGFITERLTGLTPNNHRILDGGHDFFSSIDRAREVGAKNGWDNEEVFNQWAQAYFTDLSSPAGVPLFGKLSDDFYKLLKSIGVSDKEAADFVTI